jgi:hypothetical protein
MSAVRLGLCLAILLGLAGLTLQNLTPQLSLVFLSWRSPPLALGYLILGGIGAGIVTGLLLLGILRLLSYLTWRQGQSPSPRPQPQSKSEPEPDWDWDDRPPASNQPPPQSPPVDRPVDKANYLREDWSYEVDQKPKSGSQSGSSYSFSYRDSDKSGVGKRESVYDADYRVIVPPPASDDDDFGDDEDER